MEWLGLNSGLSGSDPEFCKWKSRLVCISLEQSKKERKCRYGKTEKVSIVD
jgi:hypothetical protein